MSVLSAVRRGGGRHRVWLWVALAAVLVPGLTLVYSATVEKTYTATVRIRVLSSTADPFMSVHPVSPAKLAGDAALLRSFLAAQGAAEQLPRQLPNRPALLATAAALQRKVTIGVETGGRALVVRSRAGDPEEAGRVAIAFARSLLEFLGAAAVKATNQAVATVGRRIASLPSRGAARREATSRLARRLAPIVAQKPVLIVGPATTSSRPLVTAAIAAMIAVLALLVLLLVTGAVRPPTTAD